MSIHNDGETIIPVRWFWADDDAPWLEGPTVFGSRNWAQSKQGWPGLGEVQGAPRAWNDGKPVPGLVGDHICGTLKMFEEGGSIHDRQLCNNAAGAGTCCIDVVTCCDLASLGPTFPLHIQSSTTDGPAPAVPAGTDVLMTRFAVPGGGWEWTGTLVVPGVLPHPITLAFIITCNPFSFQLTTIGGGTTFTQTDSNAVNTPLGIRWPFYQPFWDIPGHESELWVVIAGTDPGEELPPPMPPIPHFLPPGFIPPGYFPPGYLPGS